MMTVVELKKMLSGMPDDYQLIIENPNGAGYTPVRDLASGHYVGSAWTGMVLPGTIDLPNNSVVLKGVLLDGDLDRG
jgi:hypothetical protein